MTPRRLQRWISWLLPLFILRAFVPTGFMWAPSAEGMQLVMCSGAGAVSTPGAGAAIEGTAAADHAHHHSAGGAHDHSQHPAASQDAPAHANHTDPGSQSAHQGSLCPFAAAGVAYLNSTVAIEPQPAPETLLDVLPSELPQSGRQPHSAHRIRGPPQLA